jgi:hypothetical protein
VAQKRRGNFNVDRIAPSGAHAVAGKFDTLIEAMNFFQEIAPRVNLRVRSTAGGYNVVHAFSFNGRVHTHDPPRRIKLHG